VRAEDAPADAPVFDRTSADATAAAPGAGRGAPATRPDLQPGAHAGPPPEARADLPAQARSDAPSAGPADPAAKLPAGLPGTAGWGRRDRDPGRFQFATLVVPLLLFVATRVVQLLLMTWMDGPDDTVRGKLLAWDAGFFVRMIRGGYPSGFSYDTNGTMIGNELAFFPGYPMVARLVHLAGVEATTAALIVGWITGALAAMAVYALGAELYDRRVGLMLSLLFCTQPMSVVLSMAYSEALFVSLTAAALVAAHRRAWIYAGLFAMAAGLTRPTGAAIAVAILFAAVVYLADGGERRWRALAGACLALSGVPAYLLWVGQRVGAWDAWFQIQTAGWNTTFDFGISTFKFVRDALRAGDAWVELSVAWLLLAALVAAGVAVARKVWPPLIIYGVIVLVLVLGQSGFYHSKPRLLVPALLILVPAAVALARTRRTSTAVLALVGFAGFGLWYGSYLLTVWPYAI